jgi:hypothetical protein
LKKMADIVKAGWALRKDRYPALCPCGHRAATFYWKEVKGQGAVPVRTLLLCEVCWPGREK